MIGWKKSLSLRLFWKLSHLQNNSLWDQISIDGEPSYRKWICSQFILREGKSHWHSFKVNLWQFTDRLLLLSYCLRCLIQILPLYRVPVMSISCYFEIDRVSWQHCFIQIFTDVSLFEFYKSAKLRFDAASFFFFRAMMYTLE